MMNSDTKQEIFKFMFGATRPMCRTCCYWLNGISYILDYAERGYNFEKNLKENLTDQE